MELKNRVRAYLDGDNKTVGYLASKVFISATGIYHRPGGQRNLSAAYQERMGDYLLAHGY